MNSEGREPTMDRESTQDRTTNLHSRLMLGTALVTSVFLGGYSRRAYAQCAPSTPGTYDCSGTLTTTQTLNGAPLTVTTDPDFSIDTTGTGGNALTLVGTGGIDFTNVNGSAITAANTGVDARNVGGGALTITTTGVVTGTNGDGIYARTDSSSTDLTINATDVSGLGYGISADNNGSGALSITTTGTVTGTNDGGIYALTGSYSTDLTIEAADVSGGEDGIYISHRGAGSVTITATGTVTGTGSSDGYGIQASSWGAASTDLTINAADVSGAYGGIIAWHSATGAVAITTTGTVTGNGSGNYAAGIFVGAYSGTGVTIDAVDVSGDRGVAVKQQGTGALSITSTGAVTGTGGDGIYAHNYASGTDLTIDVADVDGTNNGVHAVNEGSGALSITTTGTVTGNNSAGIFASNESAVPGSTTTVAVESGSTVSGATAGVAVASATGRAASVTNSGTISGTGGATGIIGTGTGPVAITNTGAITSTGTAIDLAAVGTANTINQQAGAITGDILLSAAADQLTVTGGAISGNVVGQGLANVDFDLGAGAFTFDGPFAITGADNVAVHSGLVTMDGSFDALTLDVDGGRLVVNSTSTATNGSTVQSGGILAVNGTLNGATNVLAGGLLQGGGIIGGDVVIADGGAIGPGGVGDVAGTLTVNGNLTLNQGSDLNYNFGQANVVGGSLNDLLNVGGDLVLDGTLNITATVGGTFGAGIYRVINYGGALTNNGLDVTSSDHIVQTSVAGQVNLINTGGLTISFWDGDLGPKYNGMVDGGSGTWQATGGDNWTDATGVVNAPISNNAFAVFAGAAGTVTVDDSQGGVSAAGMQFATDGYVIEGDDITLLDDVNQAGLQSTIRVGDGTGVGAAFVATINSNLTGNTQLTKSDLGTLVLTGTNSYTGGTAIVGGTLQVSADANLGDIAGRLSFNGGTLNTTADIVTARAVTLAGTGTFATDGATTATLGGSVTGAGSLTKDGAGTLVVAGNAAHTGGTTIAAGILQVGDGATSGTLAGAVTNNAILAFNRSDELTVAGAITGTGAVQQVGTGTTILTGDSSHSGGTTISAGTLQLGNGGTTGSITGNVVNEGTLAFGRSDIYTFGGVISGAGGVNQVGGGATVLTGTNIYTGATNVQAGSLLVDGDQSGAAGLTSVSSGAALGGGGIIGGDVVIADGGAIGPGGVGDVAGTLTVNGNLTLNQGSDLNYNFGQANVVGGSLNDLLNVGGDLVLDGTLNITATVGGTFGAGIYRVINYGGALTNNGLDVTSSDHIVQTSVAGQVNLINTGGLTISFWDGDLGPKYNGMVDGGSGTWQATGGDNWTDATGVVNAPISNNAFAVFAGAAGTVTVDDSQGGVSAAGMQFATDGYVITGDSVTLASPQSVIRVGDGSAAGAAYTATINSVLGGTGVQLVKTDLGTLVLTGANTHSGGTLVDEGTLRISSDANLGAAAGGLAFDGGTLNTTADISSIRAVDLAGSGTFLTDAGTTLRLGGAISGAGALTKDGAGALVLTGAGSHAGGTTIAVGTLQLGDGGTTGSITGDIINNAALVTNRSDVLFLDGSISGSGSLTQAGGGVLILTADNSYTGGTTIASGSLSIGNGGTTGNIVGDVANNGNLGFARSDTLTFAGTISGSGSVTQQAPGTTILTGTNSYGGETRIAAGTLLVNGDQAAATGITNVLGNTTLGGVGTIGGDVVVADGGTLAPGAGGAGALTINGSLSLASGSQLAYDFGAANAPGNPLNDVVNVGGDLTLDGTINVAVMAGGAFDIGLYRIANYGGALTDNGLAIGTLPAGADVFVQTSVANQVNLINTGGFTISYWDGDAGPKFNGAIDGGSGTWQATGGDDWTDATGRVNAPISNNAFAVFAGAAGTVTIDNSLGAVTASGLQFATDGYAIAGGALTLTGPQSVIRVGDGTAAGAGYTATIRTELTGATQLVKTDAGTLVLTGTNSHTGGTAINGGTVRIASDGNLGAAAGGLSLNGGTLNTAADLSSARAVDLAGAGTFLTDAGSTLTLTGAMSGAGSLAKAGTGTLVLAGTGGHTGTTAVGAGTLLVNGNYAGATGPTSVASGASLGGTGTIGGDVSLASGAALTPGAGGAGTLTINGDLSLASGTRLAFEFGQAGAAGGALNDLVNVGGDLVLDGTIDVRVPAGGAFEVGVYRAFNYGGALTNNGLTLGTLPAGSALFVQTSIAGQVNLVNSAGLTLNFWDGAAGPKNNGVINGGTGTWQNSAGNDNWADAIGAVNAAYTDGAFAIFGGTGGTVTVDNSLGQVTAAGMQFAANGYTITGNAIALTTPQSIIRVGDGSTAGAGFTATINAPLSGDTQLVKTDAGTLVLGGTNSYTGGTLINGGTVQVSADANLGAASSNVTLDGGTLATSGNMTSARDIVMAGAGTISTASGTTFTYTGGLSGTGALTTAGTGTLLLTGDSSAYAGSTRVAGTLSVNGSLCGDMNVTETGRLQGTGTVCTTVNAGAVAPGNSIGTLTVAGDYTGIGGTLEIEAELGGDASPTDQLVVTGNTFGSTEVVVINTGGLGAQTVEGIKIVDVGGTSAGTFTLDGDYTFDGSPTVIAGAYGYRLFQGGVATPTDGDWYLRSALLGGPGEPTGPLYQPGVPLYESYASTLQTLSDLPTLQERVGNRQWSGITQGGIGMWGRIEGARHRPNAAISTSGTDINTNTWGLQFGFEAAIVEADAGVLIAGVNGRYGTADARVQSRFGNGEIETKGFGVGATLTWYGNGGLYVDAQAQLSWFDSDLDSSVLGNLVDDSDGSGEAFSLEVGQRLPLGASLSITPQAQITYSKVRFDGFVDPNGAAVAIDDGDSLLGRVAVSLDHEYSWTQSNGGTARNHLYGIVSLEYEMLDGTRVDVSGTPLLHRDYRLRSELGFGISHTWDGDRFTIFSEVSASTALADFGKSNGLRGNAGFRMKF
jgi:fibronectin-binding autotransporter adhesin